MNNSLLHTWRVYAKITVLSMLMALNYEIFVLNNQFAPAGLNGITTMIQYVFHFSIGYMSLIINVPLAIAVFIGVDKRFAARTFMNVLVFSLFTLLMQSGVIDVSRFVYHTDDGRSTILAPVAAGIVNGFIYGNCIRLGGSTGGMDFVSAFIHKRHPHYTMVHISFAINVAVASISYFVYDFNIEPVILCIVYSYLTTLVSDRILRGGKEAVKVEMVTKYPDEITERVIRELKHSTTLIPCQGGYSKTDRVMLICVVNKHQLPRFMEILSEFPDTFACVSQVNETYGNFRHIGGKS